MTSVRHGGKRSSRCNRYGHKISIRRARRELRRSRLFAPRSSGSAAPIRRVSSSRSSHSGSVPYPGFARILALLEDGAMLVVALALLSIMLVTVVDVVLRYGFNAPLS